MDELPETLDETYARILERIDEKKWKYAHIFFQCVAVAFRPLRVDELAQFLSFDFDTESTPTFQADWQPEDPARTVLSTCSSFLSVVQPEGYRSPIVQFAHFSAQEYLTSARLAEAKDTISRYYLSMTPAHTVVAQACLGLLLHLDETVTKDSLGNFPLAEYAAQYWVGHARVEDVSSKVQDGMKILFDPGKSHCSVWVWIYDPEYDDHSWHRPERSEHPGEARATPLHYAAFCGMHDVAKFLIVEHSQDVNARGFDLKETPLHVASRRGHADIAQLLLERGADGNARDCYGCPPLFPSSKNGHVEVARILLEHGADIEARIGGGVSSLECASLEGHVEVARLLLKHGADANAQDNIGWTALHAASSRSFNLQERLDLVRLLAQRCSDIHAQDNEGRTPFMVATEQKCHEIMQLLLECGAEDHRK